MEESLDNLNKAAINNGLVIGVLSSVIMLVTYYALPHLLGSTVFAVISLVISLVIYIFFTLDLRKKIGGFWSFRTALKGIFLMALIASLFVALFNGVFYKFVEPGAYENVAGHFERGMSQQLENFGMDQDQIDKTVAQQLKSLKTQYDPTLGEFLMNLGIMVITAFVMSLIFAGIFKKDPPVFMQSVDE